MGFERVLIGITFIVLLACLLKHDIAAGGAVCEEKVSGVKDAFDALPPDFRTIGLLELVSILSGRETRTYEVVHVGSSQQIYPGVVSPLNLVLCGAVLGVIGAIPKLVLGAHQLYG